MFGKALFCKRSSAVVLWLGMCPFVSARGTRPHLLSELFEQQQQGVGSFLSDPQGFVLVVNHLPVLCCYVSLKSLIFRCDGSRADFALKRATKNNFNAFFMH